MSLTIRGRTTVGGNSVSENLIVALDASSSRSYPGTGTTVTNIVGSDYDGLFYNTPTFSTDNGGIFVFDSTTDCIYCSNSITLASTMSVSFWFKTTTFNDANALVAMSQSSAYYIIWIRVTSSNGINVTTYNQSQLSTPSNGTISSDTWTNITVTSTLGGTQTLYINGTFDSSYSAGSYNTPSSYSINELRTGRGYGLSDCSFANFLLYSGKILSSTEVYNIYNSQKSRFGL